jgi:DNA-binding transcriptional MerR regulator
MPAALTEAQLRDIEGHHPGGLTSQELVAAFSSRKVRFSEANLRRYVQLGLVPRSRRVGQKGKHLGSRGMYPLRALRRINTIKRLMSERYTLEEIQTRFLAFKDGIENLDESLSELLGQFEQRVEKEAPSPQRERLSEELRAIKSTADELLSGVQRLEKILISTAGIRRPRGGGAASPTELL